MKERTPEEINKSRFALADELIMVLAESQRALLRGEDGAFRQQMAWVILAEVLNVPTLDEDDRILTEL